MFDWLIHLISWVLILVGCVFIVAGAIGLIRMPDLYTRLHAASVTDTGGAIFIVLGLLLQALFIFDNPMAAIKVVLVLFFTLFTAPTASHALAKTALRNCAKNGAFATGEEIVESLVIIVLLTFLVAIAIGIIVLRDLLAGVILLGLYSLVAAGVFVVMDAVDVAFTEAAVGCGISTILFLGALSFTKHEQKPRGHDSIVAILFVTITGGLLIFGTLDMPYYGDPESPAQMHPGHTQHYLTKSKGETGVPNVVTSVLASYRGYDTLGETVVVFTAGIAVLSLLGLVRRRPEDEVPDDAPGDVPSQDKSDHLS